MYEFIAKFTNMDTESEITRKIDVDCTPLDAECMNHEPEVVFAWKVAVEKAMQIVQEETGNLLSLDSIELLSC